MRTAMETMAERDEIEPEKREPWIYLALILGLTILVSTLLDWLAEGLPLGFNLPWLNEPATVSRIIYHVSVIVTGVYVIYLGLRELIIERRFSIEFLMGIAALGAVYLGFLFEGATVLLLYSLAEYFEGYIEDRARKAVEELSAYMPNEARVIEDGSERTVDVGEVEPGMTILVKPGERIPLDGLVLEGLSYVDQSLVTGESIPVLKKGDDGVYAGTLNTDGILRIKVSKKAGETLVSRIGRLVMQSRKRKANIERLVDRFARIYVPVVIVLAAFTALLAPRIIGGPAETWLYRSLILLVVACPSAFVVSVPATIFTAITVAAKKGAIIKGGVYVEKMDKVRAVLFDKTGTLTLGAPTLVMECPSTRFPSARVLTYTAALEQYSKHPMAKVIVEKAQEEGLNFRGLEVEDVKEIPGRGLIGTVNGIRMAVGRLVTSGGPNLKESGDSPDEDRHSRVYVAIGDSVVAAMCLTDQARSDAVESVKALKQRGIHTAMLTGDKKEIAKDVAEKLGVDEVHAELLPEDKLKVAAQLQSRHGLIAMVGDGVNDAPALAASDVGIAMGGGGVDVALESADIVLVKDELIRIPYIYKLSRLAMKIAKQNIGVSLGVKLLLGALGLLGLVPLWFTVAAGDDGVTMLLLLNTLRLAKVKA